MVPPNDATTELQAAQARIAAQIKVDVLTPTQAADNMKHINDVARSFICACGPCAHSAAG